MYPNNLTDVGIDVSLCTKKEYARYGQSPNQAKKNKNKRAKGQICQFAARTAVGDGMLFFEDDDLDTGKGFPINASQLTNEIPLGNACIKTPNQLTDWVPGNPPVTHLHALFLISHFSSFAMCCLVVIFAC